MSDDERRGSTVELAAAGVLLAAAAVVNAVSPPHHVQAPSDDGPRAPATTKSGLLGRIDLFQQRHRVTALPIGVVRKFGDDRAGRHAAMIAYYGFFSLFPAMLALVTVLGFVLQDDAQLRQDIADSALANFPIVGDSIADTVGEGLRGSALALVVGIVTALWAGSAMAQAVQDAMNDIWGIDRADQPGFAGKRLRSLLTLITLGLAIVASTLVGQLLVVLGTGIVASVGLVLASATLNVALFLAAYRFLTIRDVRWSTALPGAVFSGGVYTALQLVGGVYVTRAVDGASGTYGTFAVVIGLLSWIVLVAQVTMLGAELNVVIFRRMWPRSLFTEPATPGDRRSHALQATTQRMDEEMRVDVDFTRDRA